MNILLIDDHAMFRESMSLMLKRFDEGLKVWHAENGKQALDTLNHQKMEIILLDLGLPDIDGMELLQQISDIQDLPVLILTASDDPHDAQRCIDRGARGYICKTAPSNDVHQAICDLMDGKLYLPESIQHKTPEFQQDMRMIAAITPRQKGILQLLHQGCRNKEIARKLNITEATVKVHTRTLFKMLGVNNRHNAVQDGLRLRLLKPRENPDS
jgi:DNA-binding NarL/FixJ family response regulator